MYTTMRVVNGNANENCTLICYYTLSYIIMAVAGAVGTLYDIDLLT